jgi:ribonuclease P protein component
MPVKSRYFFPKKEKLTGKKSIEGLFKNGSSFYLYPFLVRFQLRPVQEHHCVLISVSKKKFKRAVDRNLIKRRIREAYRVEKHRIASPYLNLAIIYTGNVILPFGDISTKLSSLLDRLEKVRASHDE